MVESIKNTISRMEPRKANNNNAFWFVDSLALSKMFTVTAFMV